MSCFRQRSILSLVLEEEEEDFAAEREREREKSMANLLRRWLYVVKKWK